MKKWKGLSIILFALLLIILPTFFVVGQSLLSMRAIFNDVFDAQNNRLMLSTWTGGTASGQTFLSEIEVLNKVYNAAGHYLNTNGGGGGGASPDTPTSLQLTDQGSITINADNCQLCYLTTLSQDVTFNAPTFAQTPGFGRILLIEITSASVRNITWNAAAFASPTNMSLPTATTGGGKTDVFGYRYNPTSSKWDLWSTTQTPPAAITRTCVIIAGIDNGGVLVDADLGPQLHQCMVPYAATVREITVYADAGTPSVIVHRRTGTTNTALLSSALATAASGALACSRSTAVAGYAGTVCAATLQNTAVGAGDTIGLTSGIAGGTAKRMTVVVSLELSAS